MKSQRGNFVLGLIVGLLLGLSVALGVALYITKAPVPFINKVPQRGADQDAAETVRNKDWDPNAPLAGKNPVRSAAAVASGVVGAAPAVAHAASTVAAGQSAPASATASAVAKGARNPAAILSAQGASAPAKSTASGSEALVFFVQAGAYSRAEDAEQQRAKLALLGLDARVSEREQSGRTVHRVRLGPFDRRDQAESTQGRLTEANVESTLVRIER